MALNPGMKNFITSSRKRNIIPFGLFPVGADTSWIEDNDFPLSNSNVLYASSVTFEVTNGQVQNITLTGDVDSSSITYLGSSSAPVGTIVVLRISQDATGGRRFKFPSNVRLSNNYGIDTTANTCTVIQLRYNGSAWEFIAPPVINPTI
jgi:hypothetical protein